MSQPTSPVAPIVRDLTPRTIILHDGVALEVARVEQGRRNHRAVTFAGGARVELPARMEVLTAERLTLLGQRSWAVCYITREDLTARWQVWYRGEQVSRGSAPAMPLDSWTTIEDEVRGRIRGTNPDLYDLVGECQRTLTLGDLAGTGLFLQEGRR